jgi:ABC-type Fe3+/spermidine/putrescine transport system ATPase subunit
MRLTLVDISKSFEGTPALQSVSLEVMEGEIVVLLGPSGCGKTTLLRIIAGLEQKDGGQLLLNGRSLDSLPVHQRGFGFVFQDYALFPHMNTFQNVAFGLRMLNWDRAEVVERVNQVLNLVGLGGFSKRSIHELSGGERQRVALARSLAPSPRLLLLDEPLGALDRALRERLMVELRDILKQAGDVTGRPEGITTIYVTHDQAEAFAIADRIVVMNRGHIEQIGSPTEIFQQPVSAFVAKFLGMENLVEGEVISVDPLVVQTAFLTLSVAKPEKQGADLLGQKVTLLVRPDAGRLADANKSAIEACVEDVSFRGRYQIATVSIQTTQEPIALKLEFESATKLPDVGSTMALTLDSNAISLLEGG